MNNTIIYNTIGKTYDFTRSPDPKIIEQLIELLAPMSHRNYLDIGCGSGNYTGALAKNGLRIEGIDISDEMLTKARKKYPMIKFSLGDVHHLPYQNSTFDGATCILATHHFENNKKAFQEAFRVLKQGPLIIFTSTPEQMENYWLCHYFPIMMKNSIEKMLSFEEIKQLLEKSGFGAIQFVPFFVTNNLQDMFLQSGKYRPEIYLDSNIREGISSFRLSIDQIELESGLTKLKADIKSGEIKNVIKKYESECGDYLFVIGHK